VEGGVKPVYDKWGIRVFEGDCLAVMRGMESESISAVVTDPPAAVSFMNKSWDSDRGGRTQWVAWLAERMTEALRVLKPGGHALVWALPRTSHWTAMALEDAGFDIRDCIVHLFGQGFAKSRDISKDIDRMAGIEREVVGMVTAGASSLQRVSRVEQGYRSNLTNCTPASIPVTAPATDAARQWAGFGTSLKPASEHWWLVRKPFLGSIAANVLKHGAGALNINGCKVAATGRPLRVSKAEGSVGVFSDGLNGSSAAGVTDDGRWPPNVVLSHAALLDPDTGEVVGDACADGCVPGCAVAELDVQSGVLTSGLFRGHRTSDKTRNTYGSFKGDSAREVETYGDSGDASRFLPVFRHDQPPFIWSAKAPTSERPMVNGKAHPTVKPLDLMKWLVRLVTPPGGVILDCFAGTGPTGQAARAEGFPCILIEEDPDAIGMIRARLDALPKTETPVVEQVPVEPDLNLFDLLGDVS
jgi:site-specific DNA-methyltransferase (adenine-specific)